MADRFWAKGLPQPDSAMRTNGWMESGFSAVERQVAAHAPFRRGRAPMPANFSRVSRIRNARRRRGGLDSIAQLAGIAGPCLAFSVFDVAGPKIRYSAA